MNDFNRKFNMWKEQDLPSDLKEELLSIEDNSDEIYDRFCKDIRFGTSGLRGKMGVGTNRINQIVLRRASVGIADYINARHTMAKVVIGYDSRNNSHEYAMSVAKDFSNQGIDVYVFSQPTPVPVVSFTVRELRLNAGIMITASHNPKEYNGYKVYDHAGNQIDDKKALVIESHINKVNPFEIEEAEVKGFIKDVPEAVVGAYLDALYDNTPWWDEEAVCKEKIADLKVCYTPFNGSGRPYVLAALEELGVKNVVEVKAQVPYDGNFPTMHTPNPEYFENFKEAIKTCAEDFDVDGKAADLIIATDPDSDRVGVVCWNGSYYEQISGNQVGELIFDYILRAYSKPGSKKRLDSHYIAFKSYVSSPIVEDMARQYGVRIKNVFTGFKNIAAEIEKLEESDSGIQFLYGFEESLGYLVGNYTRDKDGVMGACLVTLVAAEAKAEGKTLLDRLEEIYQKYGYLESVTTAKYYSSERDRDEVVYIMERLFQGAIKEAAMVFSDADFMKAAEKATIEDKFTKPAKTKSYSVEREITYRSAQMYIADMVGGHRIIVRPSGTELKLKMYVFAKGDTKDEAIDTASELSAWLRRILDYESNNYEWKNNI